MAENTRLKELSSDIKRLLDTMETRDKEYALRFETLEYVVDGILKKNLGSESSFAATSANQPFQVRSVKLDFSWFDGSDVLQWIFKAEQFFNYYNTPDEHRLTIVAIHLDKEVVPWYQMFSRTNPFHSWVAFTRALELEFGPSPYECPRAHLFKLT